MTGLFSRFRREETPEPDSDQDTVANPPPEQQQIFRVQQDTLAAVATLAKTVAGLEANLARLSREQYKASALTQNALAELQATLPGSGERVAPDTRLLEAFMPILDGIEAGLLSGQTQCEVIADVQARETLTGWLEGQRLLRERLLALFDRENVRPIECLGQPFDPYRHVAVETLYDPQRPAGTIVEERRRGYAVAGRVLRFAEVVVTTNRQF